jgi:hypothetical protein
MMHTYVGRINKHIIVLTIAAISLAAGLSGCTKDPKSQYEECMKEETIVNPNLYKAQLNCSHKTGYSPY